MKTIDRTPSLSELDKNYYLHPSTSISDHLQNGPRIMVKGNGVHVYDIDNNRYLDGAAGLWCVNVGYGRPEIIDAINAQSKELNFFHSFTSMSNEPAIRLSEKVIALLPDGMSRVFFGNSGSDANDTNIKIAWYFNHMRGKPEKEKIISRKRAYHGITLGAGSCTGLPINHDHFNLPLTGFLHTHAVDEYREKPKGMSALSYSKSLARELEEMILSEGPDTVAAFIAEPIMGTGGVLVPTDGYFQAIQEVLDRHDVLMIVDEVICGFGRLGRWFGSELYSVRPDLMTLAKGLSSGYLPISGSVVSKRIWDVLQDTATTVPAFGHGFTYSGHPVCAAAAVSNLEIIEKEGLVENAATVGRILSKKLKDELGNHDFVGDIRGEGLMYGIEIVSNRETKKPFPGEFGIARRVMNNGYKCGVIVRALPHRDVIAMSPPLCFDDTDVEELVLGLKKAFMITVDEMMKEKLI